MTTFGAIGIAGTGMTVNRKWLDCISDNIANINTTKPMNEEAFRARYVVAQAVDYGRPAGTMVAGIALGGTDGRIVYDPKDPNANAEGYVRHPDIDLGSQMSQLIMAQRAYQANAAVVDRAKATYESALQIGR
ncbi:flagellar basal body rod protein FlgC [Mobiluncus mulieris]|uniref:Flagellar basal-body rod protein FlgC n=2 Tax=Mobiluncus mulieris TaxID=2052 RepID=E0QNN5_9ACTO|nr:flagellar basal body rod protein FlgC [Mobiluncus mulieris]EEJ52834.1 flagellar basal-body rod protein FlgC [Mobiluncus mulieris ATCC 35243]EEZ92131.1 flagellar basal-body rod protein FlgC [Mobiluncus mulieris 28-1]EFM46781.1 flagellar basal-body rod protein FlgC [Mobiluncus mulieris ATCC 35239]EFN94166.1 flagellar basal-body rod protein FlgC [Mobiluncus mulieris FB024-16]MBB5847080.1 flagellar basal-body rod protein FlgC [Mobiluncus mulieris]